MATEDLLSGQITNRDASPRVKEDAAMTKGSILETVGTVEATAAIELASTYRMCSIPSNARVSEVLLFCDDSGATGAANIGLHQTTENGGAVVDADFFASAQLLTTVSLVGINVTHESAVFGLEDIEKTVWEALGLSADPRIDYDVVLTLTADHADGGTMAVKVKYTI